MHTKSTSDVLKLVRWVYQYANISGPLNLNILVLVSINHIKTVLKIHGVVGSQLVEGVVRPKRHWYLIARVQRNKRGTKVPIVLWVFANDLSASHWTTSHSVVPLALWALRDTWCAERFW